MFIAFTISVFSRHLVVRCIVTVVVYCVMRYKRQGGLHAYWQTMSLHEVGVKMAAVTVYSLRPDTTYRFRVMWRSPDDAVAHFSNVVVARTTTGMYRSTATSV